MRAGDPLDLEAQRQQALLAALSDRRVPTATLGLVEGDARALQGLGAYRVNAAAVAARALAATFPTVATMVGDEDFEHLAPEYWRAEPPLRGDLGEWGAGFPAWVESHPALQSWPYLGDAARVDLAVHHCERADDASVDAASLALLSDAEPAALRLVLMPGTALVDSRWPVATIHAAHHGGGVGFDTVRRALSREVGEAVIVARQGWRAVVQAVDAPTARWTRSLLDCRPLDRALADAGEGFDVAAWLAQALREKWLKGAVVVPDQVSPTPHGDPA